MIVESTDLVDGGLEAETDIEEVDHEKMRYYSLGRFVEVVLQKSLTLVFLFHLINLIGKKGWYM